MWARRARGRSAGDAHFGKLRTRAFLGGSRLAWSSDKLKRTAARRAARFYATAMRRLGSSMPPVPASAETAFNGRSLLRPGGPAFYVGLVIVVLALTSAFGTYVILTGLTPVAPTNLVVRSLLMIDIVLVFALLAAVSHQVLQLWRARLRLEAGARLHVQIAGLFSIIALLPAIILTVFASASLNRALDHVFSKGTENIIINSLAVARSYLQEHGQVIRSDIVAMANDMEERSALFRTDPVRFEQQLLQQSELRNLPGAYLVDSHGRLLLAPSVSLKYSIPPEPLLAAATSGDVVIVPPHDGLDQVGALKRLTSLPDAYLYVAREVNGTVVEQVRAAEQHESEFRLMQDRRTGTQAAYGMMYFEIALTLLLAAIWMGMWFANILVAPIRRLISAAQLVSQGNLDVRVPVRRVEGDLGHLSTTFNTMTSELRKQRDELVNASSQISERSRFIEAVLSGVTAGVIGLDSSGRITLANRMALQLLDKQDGDLQGRSFSEALPELAHLLDEARARTRKDPVQEHITLASKQTERHYFVQVTREHAGDRDYGFVVTVDDISGLVTAQRTSAWADVARRIAHEIKNPLTPIQLSAERLKRKYGATITKDRDIFDRCTDTIIRQVGDIGRMVDEFSTFARMPTAQMEVQDIAAVVHQAVDLFQLSRSDIDIRVQVPDEPVMMPCDRRLVSQAVTNLVKNATEAIQAVKDQPGAEPDFHGRIEAVVTTADGLVTISILDNGCGLPKKDRNRLVEPYMTTRAKGTGIGLAVVHRVTEQHGGSLLLEDAPLDAGRRHGAAVRMVLPMTRGARGDATAGSQGVPGAVPRAAE